MKVFLKKLLVCLMIFMMLFNFVFGNQVQAAVAIDSIQNILTGILEIIGTIADGYAGWMTYPYKILALTAEIAIMGILGAVATIFGHVDADGNPIADADVGFITPDDIFFNKLMLTDANIFNITDDMPTTIKDMRSNIALWYYVMRIIAISILLGILIYISIRMAISTVASDKAHYKKMLIDWSSSIALVFLLHYVIVIICKLNSALVTILAEIAGNVDTLEYGITGLLAQTMALSFTSSWSAIVVSAMLIIQTLTFLIYYIKRMITLAFLIIISPLITITYSIDKLGDGKAQALNAWLKEFAFTVIIQPFHCIIYVAFISMALAALQGNTTVDLLEKTFNVFGSGFGIDSLVGGILAILCVKFVWDAEKIVKNIFGIKVSESVGDAISSAAVAGAVVSKGIGAASKAGSAVKGAKTLISKSGLGEKFGDLGFTDRTKFRQGLLEHRAKKAEAKGNTDKAKALKKKSEDLGKKVQAMKDGKGLRGKVYNIGQNVSGRVKEASESFDNFVNSEEGQKFTRKLSTSAGVVAGVLGGAATYGASPKISMFEAAFTGVEAGKGVKSGLTAVINRRKNDYLGKADGYINDYCSIRNIDPSTLTDKEKQDIIVQASMDDEDGKFKKITEKRLDAKADIIKALQEKDIAELEAQKVPEAEIKKRIAAKTAKGDYNNEAEKALKAVDTGIYKHDLDCNQIANNLGIDPTAFRGMIKEFAESKAGSKMASLNEQVDTLGGYEGYYMDVLKAAYDGKQGNDTQESTEQTTETETQTETNSETEGNNKPDYTPMQIPQDLADQIAQKLSQYLNNGMHADDDNLKELANLFAGTGLTEDRFANVIKGGCELDLEGTTFHLDTSGVDIPNSEFVNAISANMGEEEIVTKMRTEHSEITEEEVNVIKQQITIIKRMMILKDVIRNIQEGDTSNNQP